MSAAQGTAMGTRPPITVGQLLVEIRNFHREHHRWPTTAEMAATLSRSLDQIKDKARILRNQGLLDKEGLHLVITDKGGGYEAPVTRTVWSKEQVESHLRSLRVDPTPGSTKLLKAEESAKEETEEMGKPRLLPPDEELLKEAEEIRATGANASSVLAFRYGTTAKSADNALYRARKAMRTQGQETVTSTMPTEAPERPQEATGVLTQGVGSAEQEPEQAQEPGIIGGVATEGEGQDGGTEGRAKATEERAEAERVEAAHQIGWGSSHLEKTALDIASELIRRRNQKLIPALIDEIHDHETLGRVLHRLRREGVA